VADYSMASQLASGIEGAELLDKVADAIGRPARKALRSPAVRDALSGPWLGHPVHPSLVVVPIGCWVGSAILDVTGQRRGARTLVGVGLLGSAPAALTGLSDWLDTSGAERRVGTAHLTANSVASVMYAGSWRARRRGHHLRGAALGVMGLAAAVAGGWLGGHLAYALGVGVDTNAFDAGPLEWTDIDLDPPADGSAVQTTVDSTPVLVSRQPGGITVVADRCSHRGGPLSDGTVDGGCVTCPWHGSRFDLATGAVRRGPAVVGQPVYEVDESGGRLRVRRSERRALRANSLKPSIR
jgi:nitrite reductase/ring-hydroxylating ferredoxin subunit/uncharacterized membrane protein